MRRPSFQFYPGDWSANPNLKRCTFAEKGIWIEVMGLMHSQDEYGVIRWPLKEIAQAVGCKTSDLQSLARKGVLKGSDGDLQEPFIYTPRSGRKDGEPITLIDTQPGPIWYSSRMVRDEYVRNIRGNHDGNGDAPRTTPKPAPKPTIGEDIDAHPSRAQAPRAAPSSPSPSSASLNTPPIPCGDSPPAKSPRPAKRCPDGFEVTAAMVAWSAENCPGVNCATETEKFRDYTFPRGITDWAATWRNWMRGAHERLGRRPVAVGATEPEWRREQRERAAQFAGRFAAKPSPIRGEVIDMEGSDAAIRKLG